MPRIPLITFHFSLLLALGTGLMPSVCAADLAFKRKVIDKCDEAKADISRLDVEKQLASIEDLKLVLKLDITSPDLNSPEIGKQVNKIPAMYAPEGIKAEDYWQTVQPDREIKAKYCALEILKSLSPYSIEALPEMIELTQFHTLPHYFQNLLYKLIQDIVLDAVNDSRFSIPDEVLDKLISMLDKPYAYYAQSALIEMHKVSVQKLLQRMDDPDVKIRELITKTLLRLDSSGDLTGTGVLKLLQSSDDGLRKRAIGILAELESFYPFSLPVLIDKLFDISPDIQNATFDALERIFARLKPLPKITLSEAAADTLFKKFTISHGHERQVLLSGLSKLLIVSEDYRKKIVTAFKTEDAELKADLIHLIGISIKPDAQTKAFVFEALKDRSSLVRLRALQLINNLKLSSKVSNAALLKLLDEPNQDIRKQTEAEIFALDKGISADFLKFFKTKNAADKARLLRVLLRIAPTDKEAVPLFESSIKKQNCTEKATLITLAPQFTKKIKGQLVKDLLACFNEVDADYNLVGEALVKLCPLGAPEREDISKTLGSESTSYKALIFLLLHAKDLALRNEEFVLNLKRLLKVEDKTIKFRAVNHLNNIPVETLLSIKDQILPDLLEFSKENNDEDLLYNESVIVISKLDEKALDLESIFLKQIESDKYQWAEKYIEKLRIELSMSIIRKALESLPVSKKFIPITLAGSQGKVSLDMLPQIKEYLEAPDTNLSYAAGVALIKIDPADAQAESTLQKLLFKDTAEQLQKEDFDKTALPLIAKLKSASASHIEKLMLSRLEDRINSK